MPLITSQMSIPGQFDTQPVDDIAEEQKKQQAEEDMRKKKVEFNRKYIQQLQQENSSLQQMSAQMDISTDPQFENLERLEETEQQDADQQQDMGIAQKMMDQQQQTQQQQNIQTQQQLQQMKTSSRWVMPEHADVSVWIENNIVSCDVAVTPRQQASGLQTYDKLAENRGLWFPFNNRRKASFHMGDVKFPIDIIFIDYDKISRIASNVQPRQMGAWAAVCTDVIEVNGGFCKKHNINAGDRALTPVTMERKTARSDIETLVNKTWSAPQDARLTSSKTYDLLRTITEADNESNDVEEDLIAMFPQLKQAQENYKVKPDTYQRQPGEIDKRNPTERFEHNTLPDEFSPFGDGDGGDIDPFAGITNAPDGSSSESGGVSPRHFQYTRGIDPSLDRVSPGEGPTYRDDPKEMGGLKAPIRQSAQRINVDPDIPTKVDNVNIQKLAEGSLKLFEMHEPEWHEDETSDYNKMAVITDRTISSWIDSLGFDSADETQLRKSMFTDGYKRMLGNKLIEHGKIDNFELFDSDLLIYTGEDNGSLQQSPIAYSV